MITSFNSTAQIDQEMTIYKFKVTNLEGDIFDFNSLKGKKIMIVNTASKCGLTPQYKKLQALYEKYIDKNFVIIGFPANNFLFQEPGSNEEIALFCEKNYGVTFPMMSKISVRERICIPSISFLHKNQRTVLLVQVSHGIFKSI